MTAMLDDTVAGLRRTVTDLQRQLDERTAELTARNSEYGERIEHQSATIDVLRAMSGSPGNPQPVFDLITARAQGICNADGAVLLEFDGRLTHLRSMRWDESIAVPSAIDSYKGLFPAVPSRASVAMRAILDGQIVHIPNMADDPELSQASRDIARKGAVAIPLLRDGVVIGSIGLGAKDIGSFSDTEIELLQTFAEQAVIAITSAETYRELQQRTGDLQESLEYQTATSDVLKVISRSTFDTQPVFQTMVETAVRLCDADSALISNREGEGRRVMASCAAAPEYDAVMRGRFLTVDRGSVTGRTMLEGRVVHVADITSDPEFTFTESITLGKNRTVLGVPLLREGVVVGTIGLARERVQPFTDRQIELVRTFADQAVIALENARLITETREALEQQTATAEVLQVINSSPGDLAPVFDAMLEKAMRLCDAAFGVLWVLEGDSVRPVPSRDIPERYGDFLAHKRPMPGPESGIARTIRERALVHFIDARAGEPYRRGDPFAVAAVELGGVRTLLNAPLVKDDVVLGIFGIYRQEVRPFTDKQIALLQNFAAQAVIAMENARLITETREALDQQTATAEVLGVINSSPGDLTPVFDAILDKAHSLCNASSGALILIEENRYRPINIHGEPAFCEDWWQQGWLPFSSEEVPARLKLGEVVHIPDATAVTFREGTRRLIELGSVRSLLIVPLLKDGALSGAITAFRQEAQPFTEKQIALLENFAVQAVIAMENARLLTETREALDQQTATAEVLQVINSSPGNLAPVFDAMLEKAMRLCEAKLGFLSVYDGKHFHAVAPRGVPEDYAREYLSGPYRPGPNTTHDRLVQNEDVVHVVDLAAENVAHPRRQAVIERLGVRTILAVGLRKDGALLGGIHVYRQEVRPFSDTQIALLQNFAAQVSTPERKCIGGPE